MGGEIPEGGVPWVDERVRIDRQNYFYSPATQVHTGMLGERSTTTGEAVE